MTNNHGYFRVYVSLDPRFSSDDFAIGPDDCINPPQVSCLSRSDDLDTFDQREYLVTEAELPVELQGAPQLYYQTINWDIDRPAPGWKHGTVIFPSWKIKRSFACLAG